VTVRGQKVEGPIAIAAPIQQNRINLDASIDPKRAASEVRKVESLVKLQMTRNRINPKV
jgi:hypothetical protein